MAKKIWVLCLMILLAGLCLPALAQDNPAGENTPTVKVSEVTICAGSHLQVKYDGGITKEVKLGDTADQLIETLGQPTAIGRDPDPQIPVLYFQYEELGMIFSVSTVSYKVVLIFVNNPIAKTDKGLKVMDTFDEMAKIYGVSPEERTVRGVRVSTYRTLGIAFLGQLFEAQERITYIAIFSPRAREIKE